MGEKHKKVHKTLKYFEQICSEVGLKNAITSGIKKYKSIVKKKRIKQDEMMLLGKPKLDTIKSLICKASINSCISHDELSSYIMCYMNKMK